MATVLSPTFHRIRQHRQAASPDSLPALPQTDPLARLLTPREAAARLQVAEATLERWRTRGGGPRFIKLSGRVVRYADEDLRAFVQACAVVSTAGTG
ncbi:MAG: helix-turn-helix domain-containing protein [Alphaproteobacteria bacterium]